MGIRFNNLSRHRLSSRNKEISEKHLEDKQLANRSQKVIRIFQKLGVRFVNHIDL
jgi:hypothetical protein